MGISRLKRLVSDALAVTLGSHDIDKFGGEIFPGFDLYEQSGISRRYTINRKDAADSLVMYAFENGSETRLIEEFFRIAQKGFSGVRIGSNAIQQVYNELSSCKMSYNAATGRVFYKDTTGVMPDWGMLEDGEMYSFCFMSVDICDNSALSRRYSSDKIKTAYRHFKNAVVKAAVRRGGKVWSWEGDGGLIAFHMGDMTKDAVMASLDIYSQLTMLNLTRSTLGENILTRIALHLGRAVYRRQTNAIVSDGIQYTHELEKKFTEPMSLSISDNAFSHLNSELRSCFRKVVTDWGEYYNARLPLRSV